MASQAYLELLQDVRWQRKRLEILRRDDWTCLSCQARYRDDVDGLSLQIHHLKYKWGRKPWEYEDATLATVCKDCHESITINSKAIADIVNRWGASAAVDIRRLLEAWICANPKRTLEELLEFIASGHGG